MLKVLKDIFKVLKKHKRQTKNFLSSFRASIWVSVFIGIFLSVSSRQDSLPNWETNEIAWATYIIFLIVTLGITYHLGVNKNSDTKDKQNFHDNFVMSFYTSFLIGTLMLYHSSVKLFDNNFFSWIATMVISFVIIGTISIKTRPKK